MNRFRFIKVREVKSPSRANQNDAGLDFYVPSNLNPEDLKAVNAKNFELDIRGGFDLNIDSFGFITSIHLYPHHRILIPSGIRGLLEPPASMLMAANKSGLATREGLIFTAEIVDSPYTGEIHIGVYNTNPNTPIWIDAGQKLVQFIHVPIFTTEPEEIYSEEFYTESQMWGTRGSNGFGSSDNK